MTATKKKDVSNVTKYGMRDKKVRSKKKRGGGGGGGGFKLAPILLCRTGSILRAKQILQQRTGTDSAVVGTRLHG